MGIGGRLIGLFTLLLSVWPVWAAVPRLVQEQAVFEPAGGTAAIPLGTGLKPMRLGPGGRHLLYIRAEPWPAPGQDQPRQVYRLVLRDLGTGHETVLPGPPCADRDFLLSLLSMQVFDPAGGKLVLALGIDSNYDDLWSLQDDKMQLVLFDVHRRRLEPLGLVDDLVFPTFDRDGRSLVVLTLNRDAGPALCTIVLGGYGVRRLNGWGFPWGLCPTDDSAALLLPGEATGQALPQNRLLVYDLRDDRTVVELPVGEANTRLEEFAAQWTSDGRYLYYASFTATGPAQEGAAAVVSCVWDRAAGADGQSVEFLEDAVAVGPGPRVASMVLARLGREGGALLHDAVTGQTWPLGDSSLRLLDVCGDLVLYTRPTGQNLLQVYLGRIEMPALPQTCPDERPATLPWHLLANCRP